MPTSTLLRRVLIVCLDKPGRQLSMGQLCVSRVLLGKQMPIQIVLLDVCSALPENSARLVAHYALVVR